LNWLNPIIIAADEVKPAITGWDKKFTKNPNLNTPIDNCMLPTKKASNIESAIYSSEPASESCPTPLAISKLTMATGPTASCLDVPSNAYIINGIVTA
jgi:hypothetical protein